MNGKFNPKMDTIRACLSKIRIIFSVFKKGREGLPSFLAVHNMHLYPWICLNSLENAWINCSDYATALKMPGQCKCLTGFWGCRGFEKKPEFWIWHGCIRKCYREFWICQIMAPYASSLIMPEYSWIYLNVPYVP